MKTQIKKPFLIKNIEMLRGFSVILWIFKYLSSFWNTFKNFEMSKVLHRNM